VPFASGAVVLRLGSVNARAPEPAAPADRAGRWELLGLELHPVGFLVNRQGLEDPVSRSLALRIATLLRPRFFVSPLSGVIGYAGQGDPTLAGLFAEAGAILPTSAARATVRVGGGLGAGLVLLGGSCDGACINGAPILATTSVHYLGRWAPFDLGLVARALLGLPPMRQGGYPATVAVLLGLELGLVL
jgi:hypothetical protein